MNKFEVTQDDINEYAAKNEKLTYVTTDQCKAIPQKFINQRAANGKDLDSLIKDQIKAIPQKSINQFAAKGKALWIFTETEIKEIPQWIINQRTASGKKLNSVTTDQIKAIPQKFINQRAANGGDLQYFTDGQRDKIPQEIKEPTKDGINSLILFGAGKINSQDLPLDVFVNYKLREWLLEIIQDKTKAQFNEICQKQGYKDEVPRELKKAFDKRLIEIFDEVSQRKEAGLAELEKNNELQEEKNVTLEETMKKVEEMEW